MTDATEGRVRTGGMLPMLPVDSASLHAKLFLTEDDTRTHFCNDSLPGPGGCDGAGLPTKATGSLNETIELLARNVYTSAFHRSGEYFFDLFMKGWFGRPDKKESRDCRAVVGHRGASCTDRCARKWPDHAAGRGLG